MAEINVADFEPTDENDVGMKAFFAKQMSTMLLKQAEEYLAHSNMWAKAAGIPPTLTIGGEPQPLKRKRGVKKEVDPNKPKYNPTGYMMFAEHIRNTESEELPKGKEAMSHIGKLWKALEKKDMQEWEAKAAPGRELYKVQLAEYRRTKAESMDETKSVVAAEPPKKKPDSDDSEEEEEAPAEKDDSSDDDEPIKKAKKADSSDDSSDDDEPKKKAKKADSSDSSDSDEEPKKKAKKADSSDSDDSDDESETQPPPKAKAPKAKPAPPPAAPVAEPPSAKKKKKKKRKSSDADDQPAPAPEPEPVAASEKKKKKKKKKKSTGPDQ